MPRTTQGVKREAPDAWIPAFAGMIALEIAPTPPLKASSPTEKAAALTEKASAPMEKASALGKKASRPTLFQQGSGEKSATAKEKSVTSDAFSVDVDAKGDTADTLWRSPW